MWRIARYHTTYEGVSGLTMAGGSGWVGYQENSERVWGMCGTHAASIGRGAVVIENEVVGDGRGHVGGGCCCRD